MYFTVEIIGLEIVSRVKYNIICYSIYFCLSHTLCVFFCVRNNADIINLFAVCLENRSGWHNIRERRFSISPRMRDSVHCFCTYVFFFPRKIWLSLESCNTETRVTHWRMCSNKKPFLIVFLLSIRNSSSSLLGRF